MLLESQDEKDSHSTAGYSAQNQDDEEHCPGRLCCRPRGSAVVKVLIRKQRSSPAVTADAEQGSGLTVKSPYGVIDCKLICKHVPQSFALSARYSLPSHFSGSILLVMRRPIMTDLSAAPCRKPA